MTIQDTVIDWLENTKPPGTTWVVVSTPNLADPSDTTEAMMAHGPFDAFDAAFEYGVTHGGTVVPLFTP